MDQKIVFCGGGNMGTSILSAMLRSGKYHEENITVMEVVPERCEYLKNNYGVEAKGDCSTEIHEADVIIIAVNPPQVPAVTPIIRKNAQESAIIISIAAGVTLESLAGGLSKNSKIVRVMPSALSQVCKGYSAATPNKNMNDADCEVVTSIMKTLGEAEYIEESEFGAFTAFASTGPLWMYKMIEAMVDAGVYIGIGRAAAKNYVLQNMMGVAELLEETGVDPIQKVYQMESPGGVTIEGATVLEEEKFSTAILKSIVAANNKAHQERDK